MLQKDNLCALLGEDVQFSVREQTMQKSVANTKTQQTENSIGWIIGKPPSFWKFSISLWVIVISFLVIWHLVGTSSELARIFLSSPFEVWERIQESALSEKQPLLDQFFASVPRVFIGIFIGVLAGFPTALFLVSQPLLERLTSKIFPFVWATPKLSILYIVIIWFGFSEFSIILSIAIITFLYQIITVFYGSRHVLYGSNTTDLGRQDLIDRASLAGATRWQFCRKILFFLSLPYFFLGLRLASASSWGMLIIAELIGDTGLGLLVAFSYNYFDLPGIFGFTFILALCTWITWEGIRLVEEKVLHWSDRKEVF